MDSVSLGLIAWWIDADQALRRFSDVSLLCERIGLTHLPMSNTKTTISRSDSLTELNGRGKPSKTDRRSPSIRARNLYRVWGFTFNSLSAEVAPIPLVCQSSRVASAAADWEYRWIVSTV